MRRLRLHRRCAKSHDGYTFLRRSVRYGRVSFSEILHRVWRLSAWDGIAELGIPQRRAHAMSQLELVFRTPDGQRTKVHDATGIDEPRIDEVKLVDGARLTYRGSAWIESRGDDLRVIRFACSRNEQ